MLFLGGNAYIFYRICTLAIDNHGVCVDRFNSDFSGRFDTCDCSDFKSDYYRSLTWYFFLTCGVCFFGLLQLAFSIFLCCNMESLLPSSETSAEVNGSVKA